MPVITVHMLSGRTPAQKKTFIKEVTDVVARTLDVPERAVTIVMVEATAEDWGTGGKTMTELRSTPPGALSL